MALLLCALLPPNPPARPLPPPPPLPPPLFPSAAALHRATALLEAYDASHRAFPAPPAPRRGISSSPPAAANDFAARAPRPPLAAAVRTLAAPAGRVALGLCAANASVALRCLRQWTSALSLPRAPVRGDVAEGGAAYLKYDSRPAAGPAAARLSAYAGGYRGVYFHPELPDGLFRQYAVLPLELFEEEGAGAALLDDEEEPGVAYVEGLVAALPVAADVAALGVRLRVLSAEASGAVRLRYEGPPALRRAVEMQVREALRRVDPRILRVDFADAA
ncbi:hypothetical protein AB1Y20_016467 [Prymnesium parvum]|uniref:Uncharacterized protein n=1 Tax=Prymnesium parvum TaxID=97485 RepID=A0AB34IEU8_PRYPA